MCIAQWASLQLHSSMTGRARGASGVPSAQASPSVWCVNPMWTRNPRLQLFRGWQCGLPSIPHINDSCGRMHQHLHRQHVKVTNQKLCHSHTLHAKSCQTGFYTARNYSKKIYRPLWFVVWKQTTTRGLLVVDTQIYFKRHIDKKNKRHSIDRQ